MASGFPREEEKHHSGEDGVRGTSGMVVHGVLEDVMGLGAPGCSASKEGTLNTCGGYGALGMMPVPQVRIHGCQALLGDSG